MRQGLLPNFALWRNTTLPALKSVSRAGLFPARSRERARGVEAMCRLATKAHAPDAMIHELSGGKPRKVTIARWLFSDIKVPRLDEPPAGIDIAAKTDILRPVRSLAASGKGVIIVSSEVEERPAVCDRILVIRERKRVAERQAHETTEHDLLLLAGGKSVQAPARPDDHPTREQTS